MSSVPNRRRTDLRRSLTGALVAWAMVATFGLVALGLQAARDRAAVRTAAGAIRQSEMAVALANASLLQERQLIVQGCQRLNIKQREDNVSQYADYTYDKTFLALVLATPRRRQTARQRAMLREFIAPLRAAIRAKAWVQPIADCSKVNAGYKPSFQTPFYVRRPPRSALY